MGSVLDTNVIIEIAAGNREVLERVLSLDTLFYTTSITKFKLKLGELSEMERFWLDRLESLPFDDDAAELAAQILKIIRREGKLVSLRDLFIASICISNGMRLITMDTDFEALTQHGLELALIGD